jgi:hypothetical protein
MTLAQAVRLRERADEWSQTMAWAIGRCERLFDNWHSVPPIFPTVRIV